MRFKVRTKLPNGRGVRFSFHGFPLATIAFYGPDNTRASKAAVGIIMGPDQDPIAMRRWFSETGDLREDRIFKAEMLAFAASYNIKSITRGEQIIGCPHEEGIDY